VSLRERRALLARRQPPKRLVPQHAAGTEVNGPVLEEQFSTTPEISTPPQPFRSHLWLPISEYEQNSVNNNPDLTNFDVIFFPPTSPQSSPLIDMALASTGLLSSLPSQVVLSAVEHKALDYCQKETRFGFGSKSPTWSTHAILLKAAAQNPVILHLLIAASLAEVASYTPTHQQSMLNIADGHYELGRRLLERVLAGAEPDPLIVMASFWFLYLHQRRWHSGRRICYAELSAWMRDYLIRRPLHQELSSEYPEENGDETDNRTALSLDMCSILARLIIWLFWADTQSCLVGGGQMAKVVAESVSPGGMLNLHETSRAALQLHWNTLYPDEQLADDIQNAAALELVHHTWVIVQEINEEVPHAPMNPGKSRRIKNRLDALRRKYPICSVFQLTESATPDRNRLMANSDWAVASFHAVRIYNFRCSMTEGMRPFSCHDDNDISKTVSSLTFLLQKSLATDDRQQMDRLQWPLVWVGIETTDRSKQIWILSKLSNPIAHDVVKAVLNEQSNGMRVSMQRMGEICHAESVLFEGPGSRAGTPLAFEPLVR